ncbi:response regulator [Pseudorhodoferax sp. Leaf267]|uniref:response regulator n=1 Tax=Pseudorhodoferax sp. Leaf267 TaxID=1736316 RepID=UPI0006F5594B|nr:response regulator [Pseudorhodoferax sp. Leaf267]KQP18047.1 two-component system response regulator [Pseudorhodoferax sp. Leaf267]
MTPTSILYVEDNDDLRDSIAMALESPTREITVCATGEEALTALAQRDWDILMTDVGLPGINGTDLARQLTTSKPQQWVVLCSGYDMGAQLAALGPNVRALTKPFDLDALERILDTIEDALKAR